MRVPNDVHLAQRWRVHEILPDFTLEDVWSLPGVAGTTQDFADAIELAATSDPASSSHVPTRLLWELRDLLGRWFGLDGISGAADDTEGIVRPIPETSETTLAQRLPADLRGTAQGVRFDHLPFVPLYRTNDEFAAEISNKTVHGVMHLGWVPQGNGLYGGQMAVYVKPRGRFGRAYMGFIKPYRYLVVYPALERQLQRRWAARGHR